ncbi:LPD1 domain-containing protein [Paenibacillus sp. FSL R5-0914]|uniref:LPD1 domain-containing protein n=1 Tax=Paenibacillus sp. FSL R5-0914 TaxID=2921665 RepID=UPI0030F7773B
MQQISLFDYFSQDSLGSSIQKAHALNLVQPSTSHAGGRSKEYAYDCGEELQGAKKHLSVLVKFSGEWQKVIEQDPAQAYQLVSKDELLDNFKAKNLKEVGFTSEAAYGVKLLWGMVSQRPEDDINQRRYFIQAVEELKLRLSKATTEQLFRDTVDQIKREFWKAAYSTNPRKVGIDPELMNYRFWLSLGKRFKSLFIGYSAAKPYEKLLDKAFSSEEGKEWNWANKKKGNKDTSKTKNQWERKVPEEVIRLSNEPSGVRKPEDLIEEYAFRGIQFGNWMEDAAGRYHVLSSGNAWADLAAILQIPRKSISLYGKLGLAFGARGSGNASAHFEPKENLMNLTKFRGGGSQCHEWAHALDFNLYSYSHDYMNGKQMALSGNQPGKFLPDNISYAFANLMTTMKEGKGLMRFEVPNPLPVNKTNYVQGIKDYLVRNSYDINKTMLDLNSSSRYRIHSKDWKEIGIMYCNMLIQEGREVPTEYFIPTNYSSFYLDACERGAYWKRDHELFARAFESWIEDELEERGISNSYLVTGTRFGGPYPMNDERKSINDAFRKWWKVLSDSEILQNKEFWN